MIVDIRSEFPSQRVPNEHFESLWEGWTAEKIYKKTGIKSRYVAQGDECASDFAFKAAQSLLADRDLSRIGFLLFCTESPDYVLPPSSCILQERLGLPMSCGAFDINLACSAYIYALATAHAYMQGGLAEEVLLLTGDTYTRYIHPDDKSTRTIFGDAATATLLSKNSSKRLDAFILCTDGRGAKGLILEKGGCRRPRMEAPASSLEDPSGEGHNPDYLYMNGPDIFNFTLRVVPDLVHDVAAKAGHALDEIDHFVFHQANVFMLEHLRKKLKISEEKFVYAMEAVGNTVSSTIPIALESCMKEGRFKPGDKILLAGFGVGLSWGGCMLYWN
tara:strand:- start:1674 stop:2669 length:996 start_codon:yes stop_codon:yes gene_type:complete